MLDLSRKFGVDPFWYYLIELPEFLSNIDGSYLGLLGLSLFTMFQLDGKLRSKSIERFPFFLVFIFCNLYVLSCVPHKEQRFMTSIFPIFGILWSFATLKISGLLPKNSFTKWCFKVFLFVYAGLELLIALQ